MRELSEHRLGEFVEIQTGPFGSQLHAHDYVVSGTPMVMPTNIGQRLDIVLDEIAYVSDSDISRLERYLVKQGDIVYSRRGDVEKCAYITEKQNGWLCGGGCLRIRVSSCSLDSKFLAYYLSTRESKSWILNSTVGSTMPNLNSSILLDFPLRVPPIDEQRAIAEVLSSLDDKIDLLHRQNKTLERLAETLFRQWFIEEADPSWNEGTLADVSANIRENLHQSNISPGTKYIGLEHIERRHFALYSAGISDGLGSNKSVFKRHDILFGKLRPYFHKVCFTPFDGVCSTDILVIRPKDELYFPFCLLAYFQKEVVDHSDLASEGTRMPRTNWQILGSYPIYLPDAQTLGRFNDLAEPSILKIERNLKQIESLERIRDTLLPGLMSGSISANRG